MLGPAERLVKRSSVSTGSKFATHPSSHGSITDTGLSDSAARFEWKKSLATTHGPASSFSVELPGIEPAALPGHMPSELRFRYVSVRFGPARYLRFRSRALTASRRITP